MAEKTNQVTLSKKDRLYNLSGDILLACFFFYFAYTNLMKLTVSFKASILIMVLYNSALVLFCLIRRNPISVTQAPKDYFFALAGTLLPLLFVGVPNAIDSFVLVALQMTGLLIAFGGLLSLNKSFGVVPANRGVIQTGLYQFVRHPLYAGYLLLCLSFVIQNFSMRNFIVLVAFILCEGYRLLLEERFLRKDQAYVDYTKKVKWRVIPYIW